MDRSNHVGFYLRQIHDEVTTTFNAHLRPHDLTLSQTDLLDFLVSRGDEQTTLRDIETHFHLAHPTVIGLTRRMEAKGFLRSAANPQDGRSRLLVLTEKAFAAQRIWEDTVVQLEKRLTRGMSAGERAQLIECLRLLSRNISQP